MKKNKDLCRCKPKEAEVNQKNRYRKGIKRDQAMKKYLRD
jgi:hypothetical protein